MATMNLRTKGYGSKQLKNSKPCETLPKTPYTNYSDSCNEVLDKLELQQTFDLQANILRQSIADNCNDCDFVKNVVFWYFNLPTSSSIRFIIASSLCKLKDDKNETFEKCFQEYVSAQASSGENVTETVLRCFENCPPGMAAIHPNLSQLYSSLVKELKNDANSGTVRALLSIESIGKCSNDEVLKAVLEHFKDEDIVNETKHNLALIWTHEMKSRFSDLVLQFLKSDMDRSSFESELKKWLPTSPTWISHLASTIVILSKKELFDVHDNKLVLHHLYDLISRKIEAEDDPNLISVKVIGVQHCANKHLSLLKDEVNYENVDKHLELVKAYEIFSRDNLNHGIDKIRHLFKGIFEKVIELYEILGSSKNLENLVNWVLQTSWENKAKSIALTCLCKGSQTPLILKLCPELPSKVINLLKDPTIESSASEVYENLMKSSHGSLSIGEWSSTWISPLMSSKLSSTTSLVRILKIALKIEKEIVLKEVAKNANCHLTLAMICFKLDRLNGGSTWKDHFETVLVPACQHFEDSIRLQALDLLISSHSSRENFSAQDLELIKDHMDINMVIQAPNDRQEMVTLMRKMYLRIRNGLEKASEDLIGMYKTFIRDQFDFFFQCFFEDASFSRRSIALESILSIIEYFNDIIEDLKDEQKLKMMLSQLHDSYEHNKQVALEILKTFPNNVTKLDQDQVVDDLLETLSTLVTSHKPPDSITAGYIAKYISTSEKMSNEKMIKLIFEKLKNQLKIAQNSLEQAAMEAPMYGILFCLRSLMTNPSVANCMTSEFFDELFQVCSDISTVISCILNSDSPEGHLPMDMEPLTNSSSMTPQLLLLCAWRTSKEISLLLGKLCSHFSVKLIEKISTFFITQLAEIRHRGAFEQAFAGFCQLCAYLWSQNSSGPIQLLEDTLSDLKDNESKFCATRRSAGIPYLIQAIVTTEPKHRQYQSLKLALDHLMILSESPKEELRIHSCNILRSLYKDSTLGEVVTPYISKGLQIAILGFKAHSWSERNSATLLFSALCTRIFGVKRSKLELSKRNSMSARMFFHRFPDLYDFLLNEMTNIAQVISAGSVTPEESALYPILIIIAKLQPSLIVSGENLAEKKYQLHEFLSPLNECRGSSIFKIRELAAKALVSILQKSLDNFEKLASKITPEVCAKITTNQRHGNLLQVLYFIKTLKYEMSSPDLKNFFHGFNVKNIQESLTLLQFDNCYVINAIAFEILWELDQLGCIELQKPISALKKITSEGNEIWRPLFLKYHVKVAPQPSLYLDVPIVDVRKAALESSLFSDVKVAAAFFGEDAAAANIGLHHFIMTESDPECLELELTLFVKKDFCTKMNDTEVEDLLAFLMNKISKYVNGGSSDIALNMNDRIFILCIQTIGVLMSSYCLHVKSKFIVGWINILLDQMESPDSDLRLCLAHVLKANRTYFWPLRQKRLQEDLKTLELEAMFYVYWYMLLALTLDEDFDVRKTISAGVVQLPKASLLIFEEILQDCVSSETSEMTCLVAMLYQNTKKAINFSASTDDKSESTAFDKSETNSWREDSKVLKAIGPYLKSTKLSSVQFEEVTAKLRPAFHMAFGDDVNVKLPTTLN